MNDVTASCKICQSPTTLFDVVDRSKICDLKNVYPAGLSGTPVYYERCQSCGFLFTRHFDSYQADDWTREIYNGEYARLDPEYHGERAHRNASLLQFMFSRQRASIIGLDYGGGNGATSQSLRQIGFNFDSHDPFGFSDMTPHKAGTYNLVTAFEVFEHVPDPVSTLATIMNYMADGPAILIIGTLSSDGRVDNRSRLAWWYAAPRNGHISLYSKRSLATLAQKFGLHCASPLPGTHIMSRRSISTLTTSSLVLGKLITRLRETISQRLRLSSARKSRLSSA